MFNDVRQAHAVEDRLALQLYEHCSIRCEILVQHYEMFDGKVGLGIMGARATDRGSWKYIRQNT